MKLNTIGPAPGSKKPRTARRPRRFRRPGQDLRPWRQGPARPQGRLSQGRLRRRPDAAAAPPAQDRLPLGAQLGSSAEVRLSELAQDRGRQHRLSAILKAANLVPADTLQAKIVLSGDVKAAYTVTGVGVTKGARAAIEKAGGKIVEPAA